MRNKAWNSTEILPKDELMSLAKQFTSAIHPPSFHVLQLSRVDLPLLNPRSLVTETFILPRNFYI